MPTRQTIGALTHLMGVTEPIIGLICAGANEAEQGDDVDAFAETEAADIKLVRYIKTTDSFEFSGFLKRTAEERNALKQKSGPYMTGFNICQKEISRPTIQNLLPEYVREV